MIHEISEKYPKDHRTITTTNTIMIYNYHQLKKDIVMIKILGKLIHKLDISDQTELIDLLNKYKESSRMIIP